MKRREGAFREGFTTGSAATAASVAALHRLLHGHNLELVDIPVPPGAVKDTRLHIPVAETRILADNTALSAVIKDGGDDPDATHQARIEAIVHCTPGASGIAVRLDGGEGVGRVTLPGLPVPVGEAAINPGPRAQIERAIREVCEQARFSGTIDITLKVPEGTRFARHTLNSRLGIVDGISILGTQGTVRPYSHEAWRQTIVQELNTARALGYAHIALSSGRRSERLLMEALGWPEHCFVQAADFIGFAVQEAAAKGFTCIVWGGFFGKLLKISQGHSFTHARATRADFASLAAQCKEHALKSAIVEAITNANTAAQALEAMLDDPAAPKVLLELTANALTVLRQCAGSEPGPEMSAHLFHLDGTQLVRI